MNFENPRCSRHDLVRLTFTASRRRALLRTHPVAPATKAHASGSRLNEVAEPYSAMKLLIQVFLLCPIFWVLGSLARTAAAAEEGSIRGVVPGDSVITSVLAVDRSTGKKFPAKIEA